MENYCIYTYNTFPLTYIHNFSHFERNTNVLQKMMHISINKISFLQILIVIYYKYHFIELNPKKYQNLLIIKVFGSFLLLLKNFENSYNSFPISSRNLSFGKGLKWIMGWPFTIQYQILTILLKEPLWEDCGKRRKCCYLHFFLFPTMFTYP